MSSDFVNKRLSLCPSSILYKSLALSLAKLDGWAGGNFAVGGAFVESLTGTRLLILLYSCSTRSPTLSNSYFCSIPQRDSGSWQTKESKVTMRSVKSFLSTALFPSLHSSSAENAASIKTKIPLDPMDEVDKNPYSLVRNFSIRIFCSSGNLSLP